MWTKQIACEPSENDGVEGAEPHGNPIQQWPYWLGELKGVETMHAAGCGCDDHRFAGQIRSLQWLDISNNRLCVLPHTLNELSHSHS